MAELKTVLLVDDDPTQIAILTAYFGSLRVENILSAKDGLKACDVVNANGNSIDLIVSDLSMPNMDGVEFLRFLKEKNFEGDVVLVSSFDDKILANVANIGEMHKLNIRGQIRKPLTKKALDAAFVSIERDVPKAGDAQPNSEPNDSAISKSDLQAALDAKLIVPHYQPKIALLTAKVIGAEALARWVLPSGKIISPAQFIPLAERTGLIDQVSIAIFSRVLEDIKTNFSLRNDQKIAVNLPPTILSNVDFPNMIHDLMKGSNVKPSSICFEITETGIIEFDPRTIEVLTRLKLAGFDLSIDDFGTGASNISNLRAFPYSELKIDQSFINNINTDAFSAETVRSSITLARQLDMRIVAEGIENKEILDIIKSKGIDQAQGYFISRPIVASEMNVFFENSHTWMAGQNALGTKEQSSKLVA